VSWTYICQISPGVECAARRTLTPAAGSRRLGIPTVLRETMSGVAWTVGVGERLVVIPFERRVPKTWKQKIPMFLKDSSLPCSARLLYSARLGTKSASKGLSPPPAHPGAETLWRIRIW